MALKPVRLTQLAQSQPIVDGQGRPASAFLRYFNSALKQIESAFNGIISAQSTADAAQGSAQSAADAAAAAQASADTKLTQSTADARYVQRDQTDEWEEPVGALVRDEYTVYVTQSISDPPTQGEVQAVSDALQDLSRHVAALISDLRANHVLKG